MSTKKDDHQKEEQKDAINESLREKVKDVSMDDLQNKIKELEGKDAEPDATPPVETHCNASLQEQKINELSEALARCVADMQNYKRRSEEERGKWVKFANTELLMALIPTIDNFHRSVEHLPEDLKKNDWVKGILQIHDHFLKTLEKIGVKKIECVGKPLDLNQHEALISGTGEKDVVIEELEAGYVYHEQVLRPR